MNQYLIMPIIVQLLFAGMTCVLGAENNAQSRADVAAVKSQAIPSSDDVNKAVNRGLDWLVSIQKEDGSWSNSGFPALTALPLQAFIASDHPRKKEVIAKAMKYILSCVQKDGGIYRKSLFPGRGGLGTFNTAICMTAIHMLGDPANVKIIQNARKFVASSQLAGDSSDNGGFGYNKGWFTSADMMNTSYAVEAMRVTEKVEDLRTNAAQRVDLKWDGVVKFLGRVQNKEEAGNEDAGGFFYKPGKSMAGTTNTPDGKVVLRSYGTMTYVGLLSMVYANLTKEDGRVRSALDWAMKHWSLEENPGLGREGMYFFYHVLTRGLTACGVDKITLKDGSSLEWKPQVAQKILSLQRANGSWLNEKGRYWEADPVLVTSYSLISLELLQKPR